MAAQPPAGLIDLHSHSLASDGEYAAGEVAERAAAAGLRVWGLCDHDTVAGLTAAQQAADRVGLRFVPGIELSAFLDRREIHLLGHFVDPEHPGLKRFEDFLAERRRERMTQIVQRLATLGVTLRVENIEKHSGGKTIGRPHVAKAILETGVVSSVKEAFDRFLGEGRPAYVQRYRLEADEAVRLVRAAGGTTTIAHPGVNGLERGDLERLRAAGVEGIEVLHADHNPSVREKYRRLAEALDLVPTAGSDFHGPAISPDRHFGDVTMTEADLARLEARRP
ncbi:PHP domain-containing protein [Anaeromyxobacter sp. Fw109-5]|uniref:PHP domain-containing protein n=1 Tax=Anaeromyxobacter sp. (strain Fw109-5) TaxID=404589 RepID=UPI0000ED7F2F|nr:PHP domain-containing protein [Anaeromyxobacter sp. Fw109-5]ABS25486.1 PHP domain protein [Anaeromyxobacter sp. Fw109-5]